MNQDARAPFVLAGVCSVWRQLTLNIASLWSYLGFPESRQSLAELELRVSRGKGAPVDVFFHPGSYEPDGDSVHCLALLHAIAGRWRNVDIDYSDALENTSFAWLTECPTPFLQSLCLASNSTEWHSGHVLSLHGVLPHAPRLRRFFFDDVAKKWTFHSHTATNITTVSIWTYQWSARTLCAFLRQVAETITTLTLIGNDRRGHRPHDFIPADAVVLLPNLIRLTLHSPRWLVHISVPNLHQLEFSVRDLEPSLEPLLEYLSGIKTLVLWDDLATTEPRCVQALKRIFVNLTHLKFALPPDLYAVYGHEAFGEHCAVPDSFLRTLVSADSAPQVWPNLQQMSFGNDADPLPQRIDIDMEILTELVRRRNDLYGGALPLLQLHVAPAAKLHVLPEEVEHIMRLLRRAGPSCRGHALSDSQSLYSRMNCL